jgi:type IV pilus assembly protein PilM
LLPPEIERLRLVRAKKPWALAASALILLALTFLFALGDVRVLAYVSSPQFKTAVDQAKNVSKKGSDLKSAFDKSKGAWDGKYGEGKALIIDPTDRAMWPQFLKTISNYFPDPVRDYNLDADAPETQNTLEKLRVHIDGIRPVWRNDLKTEWFDNVDATKKRLMEPYDVANPPAGEGWVIQLICHHYNPMPSKKERDLVGDPSRTEFGPYQFITDKVLTVLNKPEIRLFGVHHVALAWLARDPEWTNEKGSQNNNLSSNTIPLLDRATPKAEGGAEGGAPSGGSGRGGGMGNLMANARNAMAGQQKMAAAGDMMKSMRGGMSGMSGMMGGMGGAMGKFGSSKDKDKIKTLTRTDFLLQFVWVPVKPESLPKTPEERKTKLDEIAKQLSDAKKDFTPESPSKVEEAIVSDSLKKSEAIDSAISKAMGPANAGGAAATPGGTPGFAPPPQGAAPNGAAAPKSQ